jgi:hypothetical protein
MHPYGAHFAHSAPFTPKKLGNGALLISTVSSDYILQAFRHYVDLLADNPTGAYDQGHTDHDAEDLRRKINQSYNRDIFADPVNFLDYPDGAVSQEIGQFLFEACVHHCALQVCLIP